jgi:hypothetical protein
MTVDSPQEIRREPAYAMNILTSSSHVDSHVTKVQTSNILSKSSLDSEVAKLFEKEKLRATTKNSSTFVKDCTIVTQITSSPIMKGIPENEIEEDEEEEEEEELSGPNPFDAVLSRMESLSEKSNLVEKNVVVNNNQNTIQQIETTATTAEIKVGLEDALNINDQIGSNPIQPQDVEPIIIIKEENQQGENMMTLKAPEQTTKTQLATIETINGNTVSCSMMKTSKAITESEYFRRFEKASASKKSSVNAFSSDPNVDIRFYGNHRVVIKKNT